MAGNIPPTTEPTGSLHLWKNYSGYFAAKIDSETRKSIYCTCYRQWHFNIIGNVSKRSVEIWATLCFKVDEVDFFKILIVIINNHMIT